MLLTDPEQFFDGAQRTLFVHAHPDDETISTGGTIAALNKTGRLAAVLTLTRGELGEASSEKFRHLEGSDAFAAHRMSELEQALSELSVTHHAFLGSGLARAAGFAERRYEDSGMKWGPDSRATAAETVGELALTQASVAEALADVIAFADALGADALVSYDEQGGYGHPDHVMAHRLTRAAAVGLDIPFWVIAGQDHPETRANIATEELQEHDVESWLPAKRRALDAHASQLTRTNDHFELSGGQVNEITSREFFRRLPQ